MTTPRRLLIDAEQPMHDHLISRCVRRAWLCGKRGRKDYSHRKAWLEARISQLAPCFALEVHAYAIMSNHFHLVVHFDPTAARAWSSEEVVDRWLTLCPPKDHKGNVDEGCVNSAKPCYSNNPSKSSD